MSKTSRIPPPRESKVQAAIRVRLRRLGIVLHRRNTGMAQASHNGRSRVIRYGSPGQSDLYGWIIGTGTHVEVEVKRPGNYPTPMQLRWLKECTHLGAVAFWADSADIAERVAEAVLKGGKIVWLDGCDFDVRMPE